MSYQWKKGRPKPRGVDAQTFGQALEAIADEKQKIFPQRVVDYARNPSSPIHQCFSWDDRQEAERARRHKARQLIASLVSVKIEPVNARPLEVRAFYNLRTEAFDKRAYLPREVVMTSKDLKAALLGDAVKELQSFMLKFQGIVAVSSPATTHIHSAIDEIRDTIKRLEWEAARRAPRKEHGDENRPSTV